MTTQLFIHTNATSPTKALVRSLTAIVPVKAPEIVIADNGIDVELYLVAESGTIDPLSGDETLTVKLGVGTPLANPEPPAILHTDWTAVDDHWTATIDANTEEVAVLLGDTGADVESTLEVELTDSDGKRKTVLQVPVTIRGQVIAVDAPIPTETETYYTDAETDAKFVQNRSLITGLTGGGGTKLDGIATVGVAAGALVAVMGDTVSHYRLKAGTTAESSPNVIRPDDYNASTNAKYWLLQSATPKDLTTGIADIFEAFLTGPIVEDDQATTKLYVDTGDATGLAAAAAAQSTANAALPKAGGTMTGAIVLAADPAAAMQPATKQYVDALASSSAAGLDFKPSARAATTADITLSGAQTIDGVSVIAGDRVLVKDQSTGADNGIYVAASGAWARSTDADTSLEVTPGLFVAVEEGTANADTAWILTTDATVTLGTTALTFTRFKPALAAGEVVDANVNASAAIQRSKLASGTASHIVINDGSGVMSSESTLGATRFPALTGDVTTPGGSLATTIANDAVTDTKIGNRTVDDTAALGSDTGVLTAILSGIGNLIKGITGKSAWRTAPRTTLENAVKLNGDTMTGLLVLSAGPATGLGAATKTYVDTGDAANLPLTGGTLSGALVGTSATLDQLILTQDTLTYSATTDIDLNRKVGTLSLTGNVTFTTSNRAAGKSVTIRIISDGSTRNFTFPSWVFVGTAPTSIAAGKTAILTLTAFGTADTDIVAAYAVQA